ncbi:MAG: GNAT family N-acetyltransferase [Gallionella sp.]|nr:GNAT family N-acetyltransferase [Gallionella sp.]MDD4957773.1 GNAT family N-acetyltransferase [Gallionella sp.]
MKSNTMGFDGFRLATVDDVESIARLVNQAYRPDTQTLGWTHEAELVSGKRTNQSQVKEMISKPDSLVLIGLNDSNIEACVHVEKEGDNSYIGMLSVDPQRQGTGVGKRMLAYAEEYAAHCFESKKFVMVVVSARVELIAFYLRRGYQKTGVVMDYPLSAGAGIPKQTDLKIEMLEKQSLHAVKQDARVDCY